MQKEIFYLETILQSMAQEYTMIPKDIYIISNAIEVQEINISQRDLFMVSQNNASSIKPYNVILNLKKILGELLESFLLGDIPDKKNNALLFILSFIYRLLKGTIIQLDKIYAETVVFLHKKNAYVWPIKEDEVLSFIKAQRLGGGADIIAKLDKLKIIEIIEGKIKLKERVIIKVNRELH